MNEFVIKGDVDQTIELSACSGSTNVEVSVKLGDKWLLTDEIVLSEPITLYIGDKTIKISSEDMVYADIRR